MACKKKSNNSPAVPYGRTQRLLKVKETIYLEVVIGQVAALHLVLVVDVVGVDERVEDGETLLVVKRAVVVVCVHAAHLLQTQQQQ